MSRLYNLRQWNGKNHKLIWRKLIDEIDEMMNAKLNIIVQSNKACFCVNNHKMMLVLHQIFSSLIILLFNKRFKSVFVLCCDGKQQIASDVIKLFILNGRQKNAHVDCSYGNIISFYIYLFAHILTWDIVNILRE